MKNSKKIISLLSAVVFIFSAIAPTMAFADTKDAVSLLDIGFDDSDKARVEGLWEDYGWTKIKGGELYVAPTAVETSVRIPLSETIDLTNTSEVGYTVEMKAQMPVPNDNYSTAYLALADSSNNHAIGADGGTLYKAMRNNFALAALGTKSDDGTQSSLRMLNYSASTKAVGMATASQHRILKYTFANGRVKFEVNVDGVTTSTVTDLSNLTKTSEGDGYHVSGRTYDYIILGNNSEASNGRGIMYVDYIKVDKFTPEEEEEPVDDRIVSSISDTKKVRIIGRGEEFADGARTFNWSSAGFEFKFTGTYTDVYVSECAGTSYFNVSIDGETPNRMILNSGWNSIAQDMENKEHIIKVTRSSSAQHGTLKIKEVRTDGVLSATEEPEKKIEFIGDSYTTGYGNLLNADSESAATTDARQSYAGYVASKAGAEETLIAYAGRGVVKGYAPDATYEMPAQFGLKEIYMDWGGAGQNMSTGAKQDYTKNVPQYVVIWLGTNDYANNVAPEVFEAKYQELLTSVRNAYPKAPILCLTKPYEGYPQQITTAIENLGGENANIYYEAVNSFSASSIGHPSVQEAKAIGQEVYERLAEINKKLNIWTIEEKPEDPKEDLVKERVSLADFEFDGNDDTTKISGLQEGYVWIRNVQSELAINYNPYEVPVELTLDKPIDLSMDYTYEIELRAKIPVNNYRAIGLRDTNVTKGNIYTSMINNFMLHYAGDMDGAARKIQINPNSAKQTNVGATGEEWATLKYTINKSKAILEMSVEGADGQTRTAAIKESMDKLTLGAGGNGNHVQGRTYERVMLGNLNTGTEMTVDYVKVTRYVAEETADEGPDNKVFDPNYTGSLANYEFDGNDDDEMMDLGSHSADYSWIRHIDSQLAMNANPYEQPVYLALNKAIDLTSDKIYTIETRLKSPIENYRFMALTNGTDNGLMYQTMLNNFTLANTTDGDDSSSRKIQIAHTSAGIGSATSNEWKILRYTFNKNYYQLEVTVEKAGGNITTVTSGPLSELTATQAGSFKYELGKLYNQIAFANTNSTSEMTVDYVRASVADDTDSPWIPSGMKKTHIESVTKDSVLVDGLTDIMTGDVLRVKVDYVNTLGTAGGYSLLACSYNTDGTMLNINILGNKSFAQTVQEDTSSFNYKVGDTSNIKEIRFFLWDSLAGIKPMGSAISIK